MSPTIAYSQFSSQGLAVRACSFHLQGVTAVAHGWLFMHWAKSLELVFTSSGELLRVEGNTPDFMLENFIILFSKGTHVAFQLVGAGIHCYGYSAQLHSGLN